MSEQLEAMRAELQEKFEPWAIDQGCSICKNKYERYTELETIWAWEGYQAASSQLSALRKSNAELKAALQDMLNGWRYIRGSHGDLYGVGWERCEQSAEAAIQRAKEFVND